MHIYAEARYGGSPLDLSGEVMLSILPEDLPEGYLAEGVVVTRPGVNLGATVSETLAFVRGQNGEVGIIPMLRGQMSGELALTREQMDAQLAGAGSEYVLYSPAGSY
jgi:hypothetical protein